MITIKTLLLNPALPEIHVKESRCQFKTSSLNLLYPPITLFYLASILRKNNQDFLLLDCIERSIQFNEMLTKVKEYSPDLIIVNVSTPSYDDDIKACAALKHLLPNTKIAVYGVHVSALPKETLNNDAIDIVINKEPEPLILDLIANLDDLKSVKGIYYKNNTEILKTPDARLADVNELPFPAWDLIENHVYEMPILKNKFLTIMISRGCPYVCTFCVAPFYYGHDYRLRTVDSIIEEIKHNQKLGINDFLFFTEILTYDDLFVNNLCNRIINENLKIRWVCNSRIGSLKLDTLKLMRDAGCWFISIGIESFDQNELDQSAKAIDSDSIHDKINLIHKSGILSLGHFILGLPGYTKDSINNTIHQASLSKLDFADFYILTPFPGTYLWDKLDDKNVEWSKLDHVTPLTDHSLISFRRKAYRKFYFKPSRVLRLLKKLGPKQFATIVKDGLRSNRL